MRKTIKNLINENSDLISKFAAISGIIDENEMHVAIQKWKNCERVCETASKKTYHPLHIIGTYSTEQNYVIHRDTVIAIAKGF